MGFAETRTDLGGNRVSDKPDSQTPRQIASLSFRQLRKPRHRS